MGPTRDRQSCQDGVWPVYGMEKEVEREVERELLCLSRRVRERRRRRMEEGRLPGKGVRARATAPPTLSHLFISHLHLGNEAGHALHGGLRGEGQVGGCGRGGRDFLQERRNGAWDE